MSSHVTPSMARMLALDDHRGVMATGALSESVAAKAGIANRDVIVELAGEVIEDLEHFQKIYERLAKEEPKKVVAKLLKNARNPRLVVLDLSQAKKVEGGAK